MDDVLFSFLLGSLFLVSPRELRVPLYRIDKDTVTRLVEHPESGMGYQIVRHRGTVFVIFNATVAIPLDELRDRQFTEGEYSLLSGDPDIFGNESLDRLSIEGDLSIAFSLFDRDAQAEQLDLKSPYSVITPSDYVISSSASFLLSIFLVLPRSPHPDTNGEIFCLVHMQQHSMICTLYQVDLPQSAATPCLTPHLRASYSSLSHSIARN